MNTDNHIGGNALLPLDTIKDIVPKTPTYDFSRSEQAILDKHIADNKMKTKFNKKTLDKWYRLYLVGKNYSEIGTISNVPLEEVLYVSYLYRWSDLRSIYYQDLANSALSNIKNIHHQSIKTMSTIVNAFSLYFDEKFGKYIETKQNVLIENIDFKMLDKYYKVLDVTSKMFGDLKMKSAEVDQLKDDIKKSTRSLTGKTTSDEGIVRDKEGNITEIDVSGDSSGNFLKMMADKKK